jgi:hypothetical protein
VRPERGRGADPAEHGLHRAVAQEVHVSMLSVLAAMPATRHAAFVAALVPQGSAGQTPASDSASPARPARAMSGASPAWASRFGSSNTARVRAGLCNNCTYEVSSQLVRCERRDSHHPRSEGAFSFNCRQTRDFHRWIQAQKGQP